MINVEKSDTSLTGLTSSATSKETMTIMILNSFGFIAEAGFVDTICILRIRCQSRFFESWLILAYIEYIVYYVVEIMSGFIERTYYLSLMNNIIRLFLLQPILKFKLKKRDIIEIDIHKN